jgi:valyl-tRNA synthetase
MDKSVREITTALEQFSFHELCRLQYEFVWNEFCDWYLESAKAAFNGEDQARRKVALRVFDHVFGTILRLLHPVMPFLTEELYHQLGFVDEDGSIMFAPWPEPYSEETMRRLGLSTELVDAVQAKFDLISSVRNVKATYGVPANRRFESVTIVPAADEYRDLLLQDRESVVGLLNTSELTVASAYSGQGPAGVAVGTLGTAHVPLAGMIDLDAELERLRKQEEEILGFMDKGRKKLSNDAFVTRAPAEVVQRERDLLAELQERLGRVRAQIQALQV